MLDQAYGWQGRIGLILPADNVVMEPELNSYQIPGVSFHGLRLTATEHEKMRKQAIELGATIAELGLDAAVYACAETSFNAGTGVRQTLSGLIAEQCSVPVETATNSMLSALKAVGASVLSVVTPYKPSSAVSFEETLEGAGYRVTSAIHRDFSLETEDPREWYLTNRQSPTDIYQMALQAHAEDSDAIVLAATNIPTLSVIEDLEKLTGKPVITSNQSILWWCLNSLGLPASQLPLGRLMNLAPVAHS